MKKMLVLGVTAFLLIALSSCQFNLFAAFDRIEIPSSADLDAKAGSDPDGLVDDVQEYIDTGSITEDNAADIVSALVVVYTADITSEAGQEAAILAGSISIDSDPESKDAVNGIVSVALAGTTDLTEIKAIFPTDRTEFDVLLANMAAAQAAYVALINELDTDFNGTVDTASAVTLTEVEKGDIAQYAIVSIVISQIVAASSADDLFNFITDPDATVLNNYDPSTEDPFDAAATTDQLTAYLDFAGIVI